MRSGRLFQNLGVRISNGQHGGIGENVNSDRRKTHRPGLGVPSSQDVAVSGAIFRFLASGTGVLSSLLLRSRTNA